MTQAVNGSHLVKTYLKEIGSIPLLSKEEEIHLGKQVKQFMKIQAVKDAFVENCEREPSVDEWAEQAGLSVAELEAAIEVGEQARKRMVAANLRLVVSIAKKYTRRNLDLMDLIQEGALGLTRGVEKFDPSKGYRFSTYAYWWIRQAMTRAIAEKSRSVRLPIHISEKLGKIRKHQRQFLQEHGRAATTAELSELTNLQESEVRRCLDVGRSIISLDLKVGDEESSELGDLLEDDAPSPMEYTEQVTLRQSLAQLMESLTPQQQEVIRLRYGLLDGKKLTLANVGHRMGVSRERIRQIQREALRRLRQYRHQLGGYLAS